jgi:hypothetical protein
MLKESERSTPKRRQKPKRRFRRLEKRLGEKENSVLRKKQRLSTRHRINRT